MIASFPEDCMRVDRASTYHAALDAPDFAHAMQFEYRHGVKVLEEAVKGAKGFVKGKGRGGSFDRLEEE